MKSLQTGLPASNPPAPSVSELDALIAAYELADRDPMMVGARTRGGRRGEDPTRAVEAFGVARSALVDAVEAFRVGPSPAITLTDDHPIFSGVIRGGRLYLAPSPSEDYDGPPLLIVDLGSVVNLDGPA